MRQSEVHTGNSPSLGSLMEDAKDKGATQLDPNDLINTFDDKLHLIQKMLKEYQNEGKQVCGDSQESDLVLRLLQ